MANTTVEHSGKNYLNWDTSIKSWLLTVDHKRIGLAYLLTVLFFFLVGGIFAVMIRIELMYPGAVLFTEWLPESWRGFSGYNKAFTYHGTIMVFMVIIPMIPAAIGNFVLPMMLGAKDVAFPRLNLASYYVFIAGAWLAGMSLFFGGVDTGWTFYTPYSIQTGSAATLVLLGAFIMGFASIFTGMNFIVTIHKLRAPGQSWGRLPLFLWALYGTSVIQVLATPVIAITLLLLVFERVSGIGVFDASLGGDPVLFQHFFWFYSHPAVYIMILPAMGVISEVIPVFSRKPIFGYWAIAIATFGIALVSFLVWGHHMFTSTQSDLANFIFSLLTMFVAVPTGVKVFSWVATMYRGSITFYAPMLYALAFLFVFTIGGLTGVFLATVAIDIHLHDTYFVVAHFHYVMVGGTLFGFMAGMHYWFPKIFGRMYSELWARISWFLIFVGFNVTFFPQFILGQQGMPRRYYDYLPEFAMLNFVSTLGSWLIAIGFVIAAVYLGHAIFRGRRAPDNPWRALTLEWQSPSPPPHENFLEEPTVTHHPYDFRGDRV
jgi:cytochrome c oxidase subunit I